MNDKQQLAAIGEQLTAMGERMGVQYRLTEEQAKGLAERMPKTGALQVIDDEPLCMAKRIEELEAQLAEKSIKVERLREMNLIAMKRVDGMLDRDLELSRLQSLMSEGWQLVPVELTKEMDLAADPYAEGKLSRGFMWSDMLAVAPSPDGTK